MRWIKKGKHYAELGHYTMSWLDHKRYFMLYYGRTHLVTGSKDDCLDEYYRHYKLPKEMKCLGVVSPEVFVKKHNEAYYASQSS